MTAYFVDEDARAFSAWMTELEMRGFDTKVLWNADEAFAHLERVTVADVDLVVVDVMLAVSESTQTRFTPERTDGYLETGLRLLEDLSVANPSVFPMCAVFLTNTASQSTLAETLRVGKVLNVPVWSKAQFVSPVEFGDSVAQRVAEIRLPK